LDFPYTRSLLKLAAVEIDIFAEYRTRHLRLLEAGPPGRTKRVRTFLDFLEERLPALEIAGGSVMLAMARHERALWEVRLGLSAVPEESGSSIGERCITARDVLRVVSLAHDPRAVADSVRSGGRTWAEVPSNPHFVCYWGERTEQRITAVEVDEVTALVLQEIASGASCGSLVERVSARDDRVGADVVSEVLERAAARGMIRHSTHDQPAGQLR